MDVKSLEGQEREIRALLETVYELSGYDFREYAQASLYRRIARCLIEERLSTPEALRIKVEHASDVLERLLNTLTIDFTSMFRDAAFFAAFRKVVVPQLRERPFIHIWHAGCASGEEAYSMAILLEEEDLYAKTRIYATDMNRSVLKRARRGIFPINRMQEFTRNYQEAGGMRPFSEYYTASYGHAILRPALQQNIVWARHNLTCDGIFHTMDVIICRNVLIYFNRDLKDRVHGLFYHALEPSGFLGLGSHETIQFTPYAQYYAPVDENEKIYIKAL